MLNASLESERITLPAAIKKQNKEDHDVYWILEVYYTFLSNGIEISLSNRKLLLYLYMTTVIITDIQTLL